MTQRETAPAAVGPDYYVNLGTPDDNPFPSRFGPHAVAVPGAVAGLLSALETYGTLDRKTVLAPAIKLADEGWVADIEAATGNFVNYPLIGDPTLEIVKAYDMLPAGAGDQAAGRTAGDNATARTVFIIGPDKRVKAQLTYPMTTGRNFHEILRLLDSLQLTAAEQVATPANWRRGDDVIVVPSVSDDEARARHGEFTAPLPYLRFVRHPERD